MKKIIAAVALSLAFCFSAVAGPTFGHWKVTDDAGSMSNSVKESSGTTFLTVNKDGSLYLSFLPNNPPAELGALVDEVSAVIIVEGKRVKFTLKKYQSGWMKAAPTTQAGMDYVGGQLWAKKKVQFTLDDGNWVWFSAMGIQKGWNYMQNNYAI